MLLPMSCSSIDISSTFIVKRWVRSWFQDSLAECVIYQLKKELVVGGFGWAVDLDILGLILTCSSPRILDDTKLWRVGFFILLK